MSSERGSFIICCQEIRDKIGLDAFSTWDGKIEFDFTYVNIRSYPVEFKFGFHPGTFLVNARNLTSSRYYASPSPPFFEYLYVTIEGGYRLTIEVKMSMGLSLGNLIEYQKIGVEILPSADPLYDAFMQYVNQVHLLIYKTHGRYNRKFFVQK